MERRTIQRGAGALIRIVSVVTALGAWAPPARAQSVEQSGMLGLPLVNKAGGWARYRTESSAGPTQVVIRQGSAGVFKKQRGRWIVVEVRVPQTGIVQIQFLVAGDRFLPEKVLKTRVVMPHQTPQDTDGPLGEPAERALKPVRATRAIREVAGRRLEVTRYVFPNHVEAEWSPKVAPLGLVKVEAMNPMELVAFGVGGDPWEGAEATIFPDASVRDEP